MNPNPVPFFALKASQPIVVRTGVRAGEAGRKANEALLKV